MDEATFFVALDGTYRHGLVEAVKFILRGALGHAFFPSPPELRMQHDKCMAHHGDMRALIQRREQIAAERPAPVERTPAQVARVKAIYADFCKGYEKATVEDTFRLDPALVAQIPDNPKALIYQRKGAEGATNGMGR